MSATLLRFVPTASSSSSTSATQDIFKDQTILISLPSIGNVGQLAMDVLIASQYATEMKRIGFLDTCGLVLDMIGAQPFTKDQNQASELHAAVEVFAWPQKQAILVHIRAPVSNARLFSSQLVTLLSAAQAKRIVLLTSGSNTWQRDQDLQQASSTGVQLRFVQNGTGSSSSDDLFASLSQQIPELRLSDSKGQQSSSSDRHDDLMVRGVTREILLQQDASIPIAALLVLCSEGNNAEHGIWLAQVALELLFNVPRDSQSVKIPVSWSHLFGSAALARRTLFT